MLWLIRVLKMFINGEFEEHFNRRYLKFKAFNRRVIAKIPAGNCREVVTALLAVWYRTKIMGGLPAIGRGYLEKIADRIRQENLK